MNTLSVRIPDSIYNRVKDLSKKEHVSINQFTVTAIAEKLSAIGTEDYIRSRVGKGSRKLFLNALSHVPKNEPDENDRI